MERTVLLFRKGHVGLKGSVYALKLMAILPKLLNSKY